LSPALGRWRGIIALTDVFLPKRRIITPCPDPILLEDAGEAVALVWGYPPGVPTPDPALLAAGGEETVGWG